MVTYLHMNYMHYFGWGGGPEWGFFPMFMLVAIWSLFWKGLALWHAAQRRESWWFIAILLINVFGVLEIVYLFAFAKLTFSELFTLNSPRKSEAPPSTPPATPAA